MIGFPFSMLSKDGKNIKSHFHIEILLLDEVIGSRNNQSNLFGRNKAFWSSINMSSSGLDFYDCKGVVYFRNNINFRF